MEVRTTILAAVAAFGVAAIVSRIDLRGQPAAPVDTAAPPAALDAAGAVYDDLLAVLDRSIAAQRKRADGRPTDWLTRMHLGQRLLERASLTNRFDDYARVQAVLDETYTIIRPGIGPLLLGARFNFAIHRLAAAEEYLHHLDNVAVPRADDVIAARLLRAQIAMQRGQYAEALEGFTAVERAAGVFAYPELAAYHARTGRPDAAVELLAAALAATTRKDPQRRAWLRLQLGIVAMERGELAPAMQHFRDADAELKGWWLVQEHIAEIHHRRSNHAEAIAMLEALVRTSELPQHMDALAGLYRHTGEPDRANEWIARAAAKWDEQLARFPEAATGHALQHHLQFGAPERALELALANVALRPGGDAQVSLARAYLQAGRAAEALAVAEKVLATPYRTARLHDVAEKAHTALGHAAAAEEQAALRLALNPFYSSEDHSH